MKNSIHAIIGIIRKKLRMTHHEVLENLIRENNFSSYAEIGVFEGENIYYLRSRFPDLTIYAIDNWKNNNYLYPDNRMLKAKKKVMDSENIKIIDMNSVEASKKFKDKSLDVVFIDADHTEKGCSEDIIAWYPKVKENGILCGHNYELRWLGVCLAVQKLIPNFTLLPSTVWSVRVHHTIIPCEKEKTAYCAVKK